MNFYRIEYRRFRRPLIIVSAISFALSTLIFLVLDDIENPPSSWWQIYLYLYPFVVTIISLILAGRGAGSGWRNLDLSMPVAKTNYARAGLGFTYKIYLWLMVPSLLAMSAELFFWWPFSMQSASVVTFIVATVFSLFMLGVLTPSLATGFYRGSWGWWAMFILGLPFLLWIPAFMLMPMLDIGFPISYLVLFTAAGFVVAVWGGINTIWHFRRKPDFT
jgi:hypothetical protein